MLILISWYIEVNIIIIEKEKWKLVILIVIIKKKQWLKS